jgi:dTDP-4-dehydrorhamnose reductase
MMASVNDSRDGSWLVLGGRGMLGTDVALELAARGVGHRAVGSAECDVRDLDAVRRAVARYQVVVNCAAWTAVDDAETHEPGAFAINATGARNVALACAEAGARMVHVSTDYVFAGDAASPYLPDAPQDPRSAYGRTKAAGEWAIRAVNPDAMIVRTAWLYGNHGPNFVATMLRLAAERETLSVVDDQRGAPTWTKDLAEYLVTLAGSDSPGGNYHGTNGGEASWFDLARAAFLLKGLDPERISPCTTADFPRPAPRPAYSVLAPNGPAMRPWDEALARFLG